VKVETREELRTGRQIKRAGELVKSCFQTDS